jgi:hypothetical protein
MPDIKAPGLCWCVVTNKYLRIAAFKFGMVQAHIAS